jgi:hypothetical protein
MAKPFARQGGLRLALAALPLHRQLLALLATTITLLLLVADRTLAGIGAGPAQTAWLAVGATGLALHGRCTPVAA